MINVHRSAPLLSRFAALALLALAVTPAPAASIDDARYLMCLPKTTDALKALGADGRNYVWARGLFVTCDAAQPAPAPSPTPTPVPSPTPTAGTAVSGQTALLNALSGARGGEVFTLAAGNYSLSLSGKRWTNPVTVQGAAVFKSYAKLDGVSGLILKGVTFTGDAGMVDGLYALEIANSDNVTLDGVKLAGVGQSGFGLFVRGNTVKAITIRNSDVGGFNFGLVIRGGQGWTIARNTFAQLGSDGIQIGGTSGTVIQDNELRGFMPKSGSHPDAIQLGYNNLAMKILRNVMQGSAQGLFADGSGTHQVDVVANDIAVDFQNAFRITNATGTASGNVIKSPAGFKANVLLSGIKSDGTNRLDGKAF